MVTCLSASVSGMKGRLPIRTVSVGMMKPQVIGLAFLTLLVSVVGCDLFGSEDEEVYPAALQPLPEDQLRKRIAQYHRKNDHEICSRLDEYGLTIGDGCMSPERVPKEPLRRKEAIEIAKRALARNERYTNVPTEAAPRLKGALPLKNAGSPEGTEWRVWFKDQRVDGKRVHDTPIIVWLTAGGVYRIDGHWYRGVIFPDDPISRSKALESAVGYQITYSGWGSRDTVTVSDEHLPSSDEVEMSILPDREGETVELRVVWEFSLSDVPFGLYVDTEEGQVVEDSQPIF